MSTVCTWKTDGSSACQQADFITNPDDDADDGFTDINMVTTGGSPVNLLGTIPSSSILSSSYWFQVQIVELGRSSSMSIGITVPSQFKQGYKNRGMYYNGNLTNGSAALKIAFGPYLQSGDYCTIHITHSTNQEVVDGQEEKATTTTTVTMTVYMNGKKIGKAFEVVLDDDLETRAGADDVRFFYPSIAVHGKVRFRAKVGSDMPDTLSGQAADGSAIVHPLEGTYNIIQAMDGTTGTRSILPVAVDGTSRRIDQAVMVIAADRSTITATTAVLRFSVRVVNSIMMSRGCTTKEVDENTRIFELSDDGRGHLPMTLMLAPPPYDDVERELVQAMTGQWQTLKFVVAEDDINSTNQRLLHIANAHGDIVAQCERQQPDMGDDDIAALTRY